MRKFWFLYLAKGLIVWPGGFVVDGSVYIDQFGQLHNSDKLKKSIEFSQLLQKKLNSNTYNARQFIRDMRVALERLNIPKSEEKSNEKTLLINRIRTDLVLFILFYYLYSGRCGCRHLIAIPRPRVCLIDRIMLL